MKVCYPDARRCASNSAAVVREVQLRFKSSSDALGQFVCDVEFWSTELVNVRGGKSKNCIAVALGVELGAAVDGGSGGGSDGSHGCVDLAAAVVVGAQTRL